MPASRIDPAKFGRRATAPATLVDTRILVTTYLGATAFLLALFA